MSTRWNIRSAGACLFLGVLTACGDQTALDSPPPAFPPSNPPPSAETMAPARSSKLRPMAALVSPDRATDLRIDVEIARTPQEWAKGLSGRPSLPEGHGMLFVFPDEAPRNFWMKATLIPLDILFFDGRGKFISAASMVPCNSTEACPLTVSQGPARFALEVNAGFLKQHPDLTGWRLTMR